MMLLMGMNLTKKPMKPMRPKPIAVAMAILVNSFLKIKVKFKTFLVFSSYSHLSGLVHLLTSLMEFFPNWWIGSTACLI